MAAGSKGNCTVTNCYSTGAIDGQGSGGICGGYAGSTNGNCTVTNCYSTGEMNSNSSGAGICGYAAGSNGNCTVTNCYSYSHTGLYTNTGNGTNSLHGNYALDPGMLMDTSYNTTNPTNNGISPFVSVVSGLYPVLRGNIYVNISNLQTYTIVDISTNDNGGTLINNPVNVYEVESSVTLENISNVNCIFKQGTAIHARTLDLGEEADIFRVSTAIINLMNKNLTGSNLTDLDLTGVDLSGANLTGADLTGIVSGDITGTPTLPTSYNIISEYIIGPQVNLTGADLTGADLTGVDLSGANLIGATLTNATLTNATLDNIHIYDSLLRNVNLLNHNVKAVSAPIVTASNDKITIDIDVSFMWEGETINAIVQHHQ